LFVVLFIFILKYTKQVFISRFLDFLFDGLDLEILLSNIGFVGDGSGICILQVLSDNIEVFSSSSLSFS